MTSPYGLAAVLMFSTGLAAPLFPPEIELASMLQTSGGDGSLGIVFNGDGFAEQAGKCGDGIGDTDGDGIDDFVVGALDFGSDPFAQIGRVFVVYGTESAENAAESSLAELAVVSGGDGSRGRAITGVERNIDKLCVGAGDINHDGYSDILLLTNESNQGPLYVVFGGPREEVGAELDVTTLEAANGGNGSRGFVLDLSGPDALRLTVDNADGQGDLNNDGITDIVIGTPYNARAWIIYGRAEGFPAQWNPEVLLPQNGGDGSLGFVVEHISSQIFADGVAIVDDVNGDGIDDLAMNRVAGLDWDTYVIFGAEGLPALFDASTLLPENGGDGSAGLVIVGTRTEFVDDAGDFNRDGINDLVVGGPYPFDFAGRVSVLFGRPDPPAVIQLTDLLPENGGNGSLGLVFEGFRERSVDWMGEWSAGIGDVNDDGIDDIAISGLTFSSADFPGEVFVVYGSDQLRPALNSLFDLSLAGGGDGTQGFMFHDIANEVTTFRMTYAGDHNNDGIDDLLIMNESANMFQGRNYLVFGRADSDGDGLGDHIDNCLAIVNNDQRDTDSDGYGNVCDADLNNDIFVDFLDLAILADAFLTTPADPNWNEDADFNGDNVVDFDDLSIASAQFFGPPGPSGI